MVLRNRLLFHSKNIGVICCNEISIEKLIYKVVHLALIKTKLCQFRWSEAEMAVNS